MPGKMARSDPRPSARVTRGAGSGQHLRLSCKRAGKTRTLIPVLDSSGESRPNQAVTVARDRNRTCVPALCRFAEEYLPTNRYSPADH